MPRVVVETGGTDWLTPFATLLAVLVGGVISWITQARLAERRAEYERQEQAEAAEQLMTTAARAAARVLQSDLSTAASRLASMVDDGRWLSFERLGPPSWELVHSSLAKRLQPEAWETVAEAAMGLRTTDDLMRVAIAEGGPHAGASFVPLGPKAIERLESVWQDTTDAYNHLSDVAGTPRVQGRLQAFERSASRTSP